MINGHGDDSHKYKKHIRANFSSNIYGEIDQSALMAHIRENTSVIKNYPEPTPYITEGILSSLLQVGDDCVCVTNGATEAIYLIAQTYRESVSAVVQPTFSEYADACKLHGHKVIDVFNVYDAPEEAKIVWLCNPNNPTGKVQSKAQLLDFIKANKDKLFVIDQSYQHFTKKELITEQECVEEGNIIIVNSMTKKFAIPGIRVGYAVSCAKIMDKIKRHRMPWSVNAMAILCANFLLTSGKAEVVDIDLLLTEKERFVRELKKLNIAKIGESDTHYMTLELTNGTAKDLKEYLVNEHSVLIRDASNFVGLTEKHIRIATQDRKSNDLLIEALKEWKKSISSLDISYI